ncbi:MAG: NlpC/P60 family protein [Pseudomonadota bacterium]
MSELARAEIVAAARNWVGTPYRHQASERGAGADCLGLVRGVWRDVVGPEEEAPPPYTPDWGETGAEEVLWQAAARHLRPIDTKARPGDVLLFRTGRGVAKHLGILTAEAPRFVHAYSGHAVMENALTRPWRRRVVAVFEFPFERI